MDQLSRIECLRPVLNTKQPFHGLCLDEGAPHSVVGLLQWFAYLKQIHLPDTHFTVNPTTSDVFFGGNDGNKVSASMLGVVIIRVPITDECYFDYSSLLVENNIPMLIGLSTQQRLQAVTTKSAEENKMQLRAIGVTLQLTFKKNHLYFEFGNTPLYLFSFAELAQVHKNLGHAPSGPVYSALKRAYPIETKPEDLKKLEEITAQCKGCQYKAKEPSRIRAVLPQHCVFNSMWP